MPTTRQGELAMGILGALSGDPNIAQAGRMISRRATQQRPRPISAGPYGSVVIDAVTGQATSVPEVEEAIRRMRAHETGITTQKFEQQREIAELNLNKSQRKELAQGITDLELLDQTIVEMEQLQQSGGNVGRESIDALAGMLEEFGAEQPARWVERAGYNRVEEQLKPRLRSIFTAMLNDTKGAPSDYDARMLRENDPSARGFSMAQRLDRLRMARKHYASFLEKYGGPLTVAPTTTTTPAQTAVPARPEGLSDAEWNEWLELKGYTR